MSLTIRCSLFFCAVGPLIGGVVMIMLSLLSGELFGVGSRLPLIILGLIFVAYLFGIIPSIVTGIFYGLSFKLVNDKKSKLYEYLHISFTCLVGMVSTIIFFWWQGVLYGVSTTLVLTMVAGISSIICCILVPVGQRV